MRNQWRLLLRNHHFLSPTTISRPLSHFQVTSTPKSSLSSSSFLPHSNYFEHPFLRHFSSIHEKSPESVTLLSIFSKPINGDEIKNELDANNVVITRDLLVNVLRDLNSDPKTAIKLFDWVLERENGSLSSKAYNFMLGILGSNALVKELWKMVDSMRKRGYGVRKGAFDKVLERFEKDGLQSDVEKLKGLYSKDLTGASADTASARVSKIVRREAWDENVEKELSVLGVEYTSELVKLVLEKLSEEPMKGLIFFRWVGESGLFKHDQQTYNAMAVILGRQECLDRFWIVVEDMKNAGYEIELETYVKVLERFVRKRMMKDSVSLYEVAMNGANRPSRRDCMFLLKKIAVAKVLDMELFSRVVKAFTDKGFALDDSMLDAVLKSLTSVGRMRMYNNVLDAMVKGGYKPSGAMQNRVAFDLSSSRMKDEANEFMVKLEECGMTPDHKTWVSLIEGHCIGGDLENAKDCFEKMVEKEEAASAGYALDLLVNAYCSRDRAAEACKVLSDIANKVDIKPGHTTYKTLISKLLVQNGFQEACSLLGLMKNHGFPPFLDPFITYLVKRGTANEAMVFFKAMTVNKYPSTNVFLRVFEALLKAGRHSKAQNLLAMCPQYIRNHADVLNLFCSMKPEKPAKPAAVAT
ncbi:pentatricopeptide repeat-containing protein At3g02490, mitochondrial-like [Chenopodium quinoa]|uniref:pentatricopeptide repeat-containing protein At3g02490, mitochondrial-like n=1 Tax=Chenopodium quinoa TaxID=63459 RepID=UPI000B782A78|nr:pentatricopeptide repeat-containing protein At3g02490, mitochondrial-like [Chenopodium quinoa]